jgi:hypothetical protein
VNDARLWHPWLHINRVLRVMLLIATSAPADIVGRSATEESTNERGN